MEPTASQVRNYYAQKNQEAQLERAIAYALQKTANRHCDSNVETANPAFEYNVEIANVAALYLLSQDDEDSD
jgi:hypothetical protein